MTSFAVRRGPAQSAEVGYRIAERHSGKGYATAAVGLVLKDAFGTHKLHRVEAATSPKNIGSQLVLLKKQLRVLRPRAQQLPPERRLVRTR